MILPPAFEGLRNYKQFILYRLKPSVKKPGRMDKVPTNPTTFHDHAVTKSWGYTTFDKANAQAERLGKNFGVAFCLTENDPFWFLDIDQALDKQTNQWKPYVNELVNMLPGAGIELSYHGDGLHIIGTGQLPQHSSRYDELDLEFYHWGRAISLTGLSTQGDVMTDCTAGVTRLCDLYFQPKESTKFENWTSEPVPEWDGIKDDDKLIEKACASISKSALFENKASFRDLWECNIDRLIECYPDERECGYNESTVDRALAQHLAFWTGKNCQRIADLMWRSGLVRDKWTTHKTYVQRTVLSAIPQQETVYTAGTTELVNTDLEPWINRIYEQASDASQVKAIMMEIADGDLDIVDKEILACLIYDTSKSAGLPLKKNTILAACQGDKVKQVATNLDPYITFSKVKRSGNPVGTLDNFRAILDHYQTVIRYNLVSKEVEINVPGKSFTMDNQRSLSLATVGDFCNRHEMPKGDLQDWVLTIADQNTYNPVDLWIKEKPWDGVDRLEELTGTLDAQNETLAYLLLKRWLISCVAAVYEPYGVRAKGVLVLQGSQDAGKTSWFARLVGQPEWFKEGAILNPHDRDSVKQCVTKWIVELGEVDATFRRSDIAALKGFIGRTEDEFRLPYATVESKFPRRTVYCASVNPKEYLHDETGNRRFWTIQVGNALNYEHVIDVQQVFAQVAQLYIGKERWWLDKEEGALLDYSNEDFETADPLIETLILNYNMDGDCCRNMTTTDLLTELGFERIDKKLSKQLVSAMEKAFDLQPTKVRGVNYYMMPFKKTKLDRI